VYEKNRFEFESKEKCKTYNLYRENNLFCEHLILRAYLIFSVKNIFRTLVEVFHVYICFYLYCLRI